MIFANFVAPNSNSHVTHDPSDPGENLNYVTPLQLLGLDGLAVEAEAAPLEGPLAVGHLLVGGVAVELRRAERRAGERRLGEWA